MLLTPSASLLDAVAVEAATSSSASRPSTSDAPVALVEVPGLEAAVALADEIAPEHLELICDGATRSGRDGDGRGLRLRRPRGGTAFGDYVAGSNHVLPTGGAARFAARSAQPRFGADRRWYRCRERATRALAPHVSSVARAEGFPVHAESAEARVDPQTTEG